jgi:uncharacterized protein YxjI
MRYLMRRGAAGPDGSPSIEDDQGRRPYRVTGSDAGPDPMVVVADARGAALCVLRFPADARSATCEILHGQHQVRIVTRDASSRRLRFRITQEGEGTLMAQGNVARDEYVVRHGLRRLATVSKKGSPHPGMFGVEIVPAAGEARALRSEDDGVRPAGFGRWRMRRKRREGRMAAVPAGAAGGAGPEARP